MRVRYKCFCLALVVLADAAILLKIFCCDPSDDVVITSIICATVLALAALLCMLLCDRYEAERKRQDTQKSAEDAKITEMRKAWKNIMQAEAVKVAKPISCQKAVKIFGRLKVAIKKQK